MDWIVVSVVADDGKVTWTGKVARQTTPAAIASAQGASLPDDLVCARFNGRLADLQEPLIGNGTLEWVFCDSPDGLEVIRHSLAHVLAQAVMGLWSQSQLALGPATEEGFYYDFDSPRTFQTADLERIERAMAEIIHEDLRIQREDWSLSDARACFTSPYKRELLDGLVPDADQGTVTVYRQGSFVDLCRGPHVSRTGRLRPCAFKLLSAAGAYWRGDENRPMLQRIYGAAFAAPEELDDFLARREEAIRRDHRRLGQELDLFSVRSEAPGFPFFHPKGMVLRQALERFWREEHLRRGYLEVQTPVLLREELWHTSGHMQYFQDNMYFSAVEGDRYALKPMNCPGGMVLFKRRLHSYRDLPLRLAELGLVHRHERSGTLHGLMRARCFTQDDAHIFMTPEQIQGEIEDVLELIDHVYSAVFGFSYHVELSTKPDKAMGEPDIWDMATEALAEAMRAKGMSYQIHEGEGAFYGPKIDFHLRDSLGRTWQCGTIQLDFLLPERFQLQYIGRDGQRHRPIMLHRVLFGSLERFLAILTEHFAGAFPTWMAPVQVMVIPVYTRSLDYAQQTVRFLNSRQIRAEADDRPQKMGYKIRDAQTQRIPYMLIVGDREEEQQTVSVRRRQEELGRRTRDEFAAMLTEEIEKRRRPETALAGLSETK